jgi:hypothetical protein
MTKSLTIYAENEVQLTKIKALMLALDISFKENERPCIDRHEDPKQEIDSNSPD